MSQSRSASTSVEVVFPRQIDLHASLAPLGRSGDDLLDRWDGRTLLRSIRLAKGAPPLAYAADVDEPVADRLRVVASVASDPAALAAAVGGTLLTDDRSILDLAAADPAIAGLVERYPSVVPVLYVDPFAALIRSISAQQVNLRWAATIRARLAQHYGERVVVGEAFVQVLDAQQLARATIDALRELQLTNAKARAVVATARAALDGELELDDLAQLDDEQLISHLTRLPGIGRWSAEWFIARTLGRPRVVAGDLGVRKAVGRLYATPMPTEEEVRRMTEHWGPAATLAQALALHDLALSPRAAPAG